MAGSVSQVGDVVRGLARLLRAERLRGLELAGYLSLKLGSDLMVPWSTKLLVDDVLPRRDLGRLVAWGALIGVSWLVGSAATYRRTLVSGALAARALAALRAQCLAKLHALPLRTLRKSASGDLVAIVALDVESLHDVVERVFPALVFETASLLLVFGLALTLNGWLAVFVVALGAPLFASLYFRANHKLGEASRVLQDEKGGLTNVVSQQLANALVIRTFGLAGWAAREFGAPLGRVTAWLLRVARIQALLAAGTDLVFHGMRFAVLGFGALLVVRGKMTVGELFAFFTLVGGLIAPFVTVAEQFAELKRAAGSFARIDELLAQAPELDAGVDSMPPLEHAIRLRNVTVRHADLPILRDVSCTIPKGALVALVGPSGSGKSTLLGLLSRLYDPDQGEVLFDERDLRSFTRESLRTRVALVPQNPYLFDLTVRQNVELGRLGASADDAAAALRDAGLVAEAELRPLGIETPSGEQGAKLSGGQAQRVALARALMRDASVLLLDEATSSLDADTEARVLDALMRVRERGSTIVFATHRAAAAKRADVTLTLTTDGLVVGGAPCADAVSAPAV